MRAWRAATGDAGEAWMGRTWRLRGSWFGVWFAGRCGETGDVTV